MFFFVLCVHKLCAKCPLLWYGHTVLKSCKQLSGIISCTPSSASMYNLDSLPVTKCFSCWYFKSNIWSCTFNNSSVSLYYIGHFLSFCIFSPASRSNKNVSMIYRIHVFFKLNLLTLVLKSLNLICLCQFLLMITDRYWFGSPELEQN